MLKFILTTNCYNNCSYCITRNICIEETDNVVAITKLFKKLRRDGHDAIMLTGGEPTLHKQFLIILGAAIAIFKEVHITTINPIVLSDSLSEYFDSITFSIHYNQNIIPYINGGVSVPVYASIMAHLYYPSLPAILKQNRFSGLMINEDQRGSTRFDKELPNMGDTFSYKVNRIGHCLDEKIIMPNLTIYNNFRPWL